MSTAPGGRPPRKRKGNLDGRGLPAGAVSREGNLDGRGLPAGGATRVGDLSAATKEVLRDHVMGAGELLRSNGLRPEPLFEDVTRAPQPSLFEPMVDA